MAKFSISGEDLDEIGELDDRNKSKSRFKVEQVSEASAEERRNSWSDRMLSHAAKRVIMNQNRPRGISTSSSSPPMSPSLNMDSYDTGHIRSANLNTLETLPHVDHYRNLLSAGNFNMKKRPTLLELHEMQEDFEGDVDGALSDEKQMQIKALNGEAVATGGQHDAKPLKFGWIKGVLIRCLLNIWGVMLFLRLSWVVGQAGIGLSILVVCLSCVVTVLTTLSMSAICTNGQVKGGGAYYLISRSLGPEFGGAIGLIFSVANAVAVAMYIVGFSETIRDMLKDNNVLMVDEINDVRIIGLITVCFLLALALIGMEWEARAQVILLAILLIAMINIIVGSFIPPNEAKQSKGFVGYSSGVIKENFKPDFRNNENFFSVFAIFFPAATGILAGANISGDLKDAQKAIPKGTLVAILISSISYIGMAVLAGASVERDAIGNMNITESSNSTNFCLEFSCKFGLQNDMQAMRLISGFGPLVTAGIFAATLSSALASLVSAPKVFQAVCKDKIFPYISIFGKGYGKSDEPRLAYILTFFIAAGFIGIGHLNAIAPLISNFFLMSYALINYSCFDASFAKSPGWRPAFKYYNMWLALFGAILCLAVMFIINWWTALITFFLNTSLYAYVHYKKPDINWGSSTQAHVYKNALNSTLKLVSVSEHIKNYRPQVIVLAGHPICRPDLIKFAATITKDISLFICADIILDDKNLTIDQTRGRLAYKWFSKNKIKAFYSSIKSNSFRNGVTAALQTSGLGKLKPNTLLLGFKRNWVTSIQSDVHEYVSIIHDAFDLRYGVGILRIDEGFCCQSSFTHFEEVNYEDEKSPKIERKETKETSPESRDNPNPDSPYHMHTDRRMSCRPLIKASKKHGTIDVWWLFDDGGLTLLIPYLLSGHWRNSKLRVFGASSRKGELDADQRSMATLLSKFRIDCASIKMISDIGRKPSIDGIDRFDDLIAPWVLGKDESPVENPWKVSEIVLSAQRDRTYRHIRLREILQEHSCNANLIVMTLPMPRKSIVPSGLYMCWLETITKGMPPILLLRGNQESVLTFYS